MRHPACWVRLQCHVDRLLVTGFGPFLDVEDNPSAILARGSGLPHRTLEVSFQAVDEFWASEELSDYDAVLMLGVAGKSERMRVETTAQNRIGATPDVLGCVHGPAQIDPTGPPQLGATLWHSADVWQEEEWEISVDAGSYLCNYSLYTGLRRRLDLKIGFLHVPPADVLPLDQQAGQLTRIVSLLRENG